MNTSFAKISLILAFCGFFNFSTNAQLFINEFLASNASSITDESGAFEDWIELYNAGPTDVNLAGYYISDDATNPLIWQISADNASLTTVPAGGYLILWADKDTEEGANHVDIKLGAGGEDLVLTAPDGVTTIDQLTFGPQSDDISYGRELDGAANFQFFTSPTPAAANMSGGGTPTYMVTLNLPILSGLDDGEEFSGGGVTLVSSDIEMVQDNGNTFTSAFRFANISLPANATINSAYIQFYAEEVQTGSCNLTIAAEDAGNAAPFQSLNNNFTNRSTTNASVAWTPPAWPIIGANGADQQTPDLTNLVQEVLAHPAWQEGNAMAFIFTGSGTRTTYSYDQNPALAARLIIEAELPLPTTPIPQLFINEVVASASTHRDASGKREDWIEIYNPNAEDVDISGLYLTDDYGNLDKWQIGPGTVVPTGGFLLFFADKDPEEGPLHADFSLKGGGEEVALVQLLADGLTIIDSVSYVDMPFLASYGRQTDGGNNWVFFGQVTPEASNNGSDLYLPSPIFSVPSGSYSGTQSVQISSPTPGATIYYTTDGSLPSTSSAVYSGAINVSSTGSLRAIAVLSGHTNSQASDATYLINENHNVPIVYLTTDPDNFFDDEIGIYVDGTNGVVAYCSSEPVNWAQDWERPTNMKMFLPDGQLAFDVDAGVEIAGACSRNHEMKSLAINLRDKEFGYDAIEYPLFPEREHEFYQRIKIRNSGQDYIRLGFRDMLNQSMIFGKLDIDLQAGRPCLLYINGEFWGTYNIREKYAGEYFEVLYDVNENDLDIIKSPGLFYSDVKKGSEAIYDALYSVVESSNMSNNSDWDYFQSQVDVNEMMNYWITMTYMANYDWPANNLTVWRERAPNAKWRYGMADTDGSTGNNLTSMADPDFNTFASINDANSQSWPNHSNSTLFIRKALDRQEFREEFLQRSCSVMELIFSESRAHSFVDDMVAIYEPNVPAQLDRWGYDNAMGGNIYSWNYWIELYKDFWTRRPGFFRQHLNDFYNLNGFYDLTISFDANSGGDVFVNTNEMEIPYDYTGTYFRNVPLRLTAVAQPGYTFSHWLETGQTDPVIELTASSNTTRTPIFELLDCTQIPAGTPCNDGDACTSNDVYDANCHCAGTIMDTDSDGVCDAEDQCPGFDDSIDQNNNGIPDGCDCTDNDGDLVCAENDCDDNNPNIPAAVGSACDDGNAQTSNDVIQADGCTCQGTVDPPSGEYCGSNGDTPWHEWIAGVQLNTLNNTSGKGMYSDFTNLLTNLSTGASYSLTLTAGYSYTSFDEYFRVWIDFNQNELFESGEIVFEGVLSGIPDGTLSGVLTGTVNVPSGAQNGLTRMRVSMQQGAYADPCGNFPIGEVEDYSIFIEGGGNNGILTLNNCPDNIVQTAAVGQTEMTVSWTAPTASTTCTPNTVVVTQTAGPSSGSSFVAGTTTTITYTATDECGNLEECSFLVTVNASTGSGYCESESSSPWHDWISGVELNTINNQSGKRKYSDFTNLSTSLTPNMTYDIHLTTGYSYLTFDEYWKVWIDYNQNQLFEEPSELVFSGTLSAPPVDTPTGLLSGQFTVLPHPTPGSTRMRVAMKRGSEPNPCELFAEGEVEDYTVIISSNFNGNEPQARNSASGEFSVFPNPASSEVSVQVNGTKEVERLEIYNLASQRLLNLEALTNQRTFLIEVSNWQPGLYFVQLQLKDGQRLMQRFIVQHTTSLKSKN